MNPPPHVTPAPGTKVISFDLDDTLIRGPFSQVLRDAMVAVTDSEDEATALRQQMNQRHRELLDDDETCLAALQAFRRHLHPDGTVLVPLWIPDRTSADDLGVARESVDDAGTTLRYTPLSEQYDPQSRTRRTEVRYERIQSDGTAESVEKQWIIHWQTLESMTALAAEAGLAVSSVDPAASELTGQPGEEFTVTLSHHH